MQIQWLFQNHPSKRYLSLHLCMFQSNYLISNHLKMKPGWHLTTAQMKKVQGHLKFCLRIHWYFSPGKIRGLKLKVQASSSFHKDLHVPKTMRHKLNDPQVFFLTPYLLCLGVPNFNHHLIPELNTQLEALSQAERNSSKNWDKYADLSIWKISVKNLMVLKAPKKSHR